MAAEAARKAAEDEEAARVAAAEAEARAAAEAQAQAERANYEESLAAAAATAADAAGDTEDAEALTGEVGPSECSREPAESRGGWEKLWNDEYEREYYYREADGDTSWEPPPEWADEAPEEEPAQDPEAAAAAAARAEENEAIAELADSATAALVEHLAAVSEGLKPGKGEGGASLGPREVKYRAQANLCGR